MDILQLLSEYVDPELFILAVVLFCFGLFLKLTPLIESNWKIPFILWGVGIVLTIMWYGVIDGKGLTVAIFVLGIIQGTIVAAIPVFGHQLLKQPTNK